VFSRKIADSADVVIIHGNDKSRQRLYDFIREAKKYSKTKPVIINEDSKCIGNMLVAMSEGISWGYYNNMTKQEPPADYGITVGKMPSLQKDYLRSLEYQILSRIFKISSIWPDWNHITNLREKDG
jgi:hypothetical protein